MERKVTEVRAELERKNAQMQDALSRAAERAEIDKERAVLAAQRETMDETGRLREMLALAREEKASLEVELSKAQNKQPKPKSQQQRNNVKEQPGNIV